MWMGPELTVQLRTEINALRQPIVGLQKIEYRCQRNAPLDGRG